MLLFILFSLVAGSIAFRKQLVFEYCKMKVTLVFICCLVFVNGKTIPDYFPTCKRNDPHLDKCLVHLIEELRPRLKKGIPELKIPALEPLVLATFNLNNTFPNLQLKANIKNVKAFGGSDFKIEKFKLNLAGKYPVQLKIVIPRLAVTADYEARGSRMLLINVNGKGKFKGNFTGVTVAVKGTGKLIERGGVEYLHADKVTIKVKIDDANVEIESATGSETARAATTFFNASPKSVLDLVNPAIEETGSAIIKDYANAILGSLPLNEVLI